MTLVEVMIALALTGLTVGGIVEGYIYCSTATAKDALYMAANGRAAARIEETRSARWDPTSYPSIDQLIPTNFPDAVVTLNNDSTTNVTMGTVQTTILPISTTPPLRRVRVDCVWQFQNEVITNTIETIRAPDE